LGLGGEVRRALHGREPSDVAAAGRERKVEIPLVVLRLEAEDMGEPASAGVDVDGGGEDVVASEEQLLRPVAVMSVDVHDGDRSVDLLTQDGRGDRGVVEVARASVE